MFSLEVLLSATAERNFLQQKFWSEGIIEDLITENNVRGHLALRLKSRIVDLDQHAGPIGSQTHLQLILGTSKRLFSLLVLCGKESYIFELLQSGFSDSSLPFDGSSGLPEGLANFPKLFQTQWGLISPVFTRGSEQHFQPETVFPFEDESGLGPNVEKVRIQTAHMILDPEDTKPQVRPNSFARFIVARKKIGARGVNEFRRETDALKSLLAENIQHPNIVELFAIYTVQTDHLIMMSCGDSDLSKVFKDDCAVPAFGSSDQLQKRTLRQALSSLASALEHLHEGVGHVILHQDIKPANVIIKEDMFQLADFGLASLKSAEDTKTNWHGGTYKYSPPEYFNLAKREGRFGRAVDVWSLGCVFLEIATLATLGWGEKAVEEFEKYRGNGPNMPKQGYEHLDLDTSFHNNVHEVEAWLERLQSLTKEADRPTLNVIRSMLHQKPEDRPTASHIAASMKSTSNSKD